MFILLIKLLLVLIIITNVNANHGLNDEKFYEQLIIRSLNDGQISAHFEFRTFINANLSHPFNVNAGQHNDIFPLSLIRLFHQLEIQELHFSLTKGFWKYDRWGLPIRDTSPNAHLWTWFSTYLNSENNWKKLTSLLSGQFCASINLINPTVTIRPKISYNPFLKLKSKNDENINEHDYGYMASLPQEAICTENLTPFIKMLPCQRNKGFASLLHATNIFDTQFFSQSIDFEFNCMDPLQCHLTSGIELKQNIIIVFNAPLILDGKFTWTLNTLFGSSLDSHCPLATSSLLFVDITSLHRNQYKNGQLLIEPTRFISIDDASHNKSIKIYNLSKSLLNKQHDENILFAVYDFKSMINNNNNNNNNNTKSTKNSLNVGIQYSNKYDGKLNHSIAFNSLQVRRFTRGVGVQTGGITVLLINRLPLNVDAIYTDAIPWYLRMYIHTMRIESRSIDQQQSSRKNIEPKKLLYQPAQDRIRPHKIELELTLAPNSLTEIRFEFDHQFLRWTEFPPDPNHGLYINPATITFNFADDQINNNQYQRFLSKLFFNQNQLFDATLYLQLIQKNYPLRLYTEPLIIMMPTPDFSMPYNVICLVSTALSIAFGPLYNLTTRKVMNKQQQLDNKKSKKRFFFF